MEREHLNEKTEESEEWWSAYGAADEVERRRKAISPKLLALGFGEADRDSRILDLCCGMGETLDALHEMGFRALCGRDLTIHGRLASDERFDTTEGNACNCPYEDGTFDWVTCVHSMHHFESASGVQDFVDEAYRLLKPGGRLAIIDFPNSLQIQLAFRFFLFGKFLWTDYLKRFGRIIQEEWSFLKDYLPQWGEVRKILHEGAFEVESEKRTLFYFYLTLRKPE